MQFVQSEGAYDSSSNCYTVRMSHAKGKNINVLLAFATVSILSIGTVVYHVVEKFSWVDAYYFSVITLTTVGYGDMAPHTTFGKIFTTIYIFIGIGIITAFITHTFRRRSDFRIMRFISKLDKERKQ